eukprot:TRINITY_DN4521_c0_g1_i1.p1 TRINITY_DN4521_c0_g1~~TRINITY_DN4521_c0_g1_i1.p1  ORF type:complete len:802 (+),score=369.51 TRINITY_DN4521_c0_g1_i1:128-2533(+)
MEINVSTLAIGNAHYFKESSNTKAEELKKLLDSNNDKDKLEAMKRLIAALSRGKDMSIFFPDVVKNVVCSNLEVKKLVYTYLVHYADTQSETALLAIATFQKDLKDKNQLIRALALRVMSSIRVRVTTQIVILAIQQTIRDSSAFVRKTAAHAIPKVFSMDPDQREALIPLIEELLSDKSTLVLGSVIAAFREVCPDNWKIIHPHFRKFCNYLPDIDEWGQLAIVEMLTRYARANFTDPNIKRKEREKKPKVKKPKQKKEKFYSDSESGSATPSEDESEYESEIEDDDVELDADHRLLLRSTLPLLQNRNHSVVLAVCILYNYIAPEPEIQIIAKSLVRIMRNSREIQYVVLANIATVCSNRASMFSNYLTDFFVSANDPNYCRDLKLEILTYLASETNIAKILREFNAYVHFEDKKFVAATIQAIGRCALQIPEVTESCMHGLMALLSKNSDVVVAESVVVLKKLLQANKNHRDSVIKQLTKLLDKITDPNARASIVWVIGEFSESIPLLAPDILRKLAKNFVNEENTVKLQIINLASKLILCNPQQTQLLVQYVFNMARYDLNYDIRDRSRALKQILLTTKTPNLRQNAKALFIGSKPIPVSAGPSEDRNRISLGTLSHIVKHTTLGYIPIPDFPVESVDPSLRNQTSEKEYSKFLGNSEKGFYSDDDKKKREEDDFYSDYSGSDERNSGDDSDDRDDNDGSRSASGSGSGSYSRSYDEDDDDYDNENNGSDDNDDNDDYDDDDRSRSDQDYSDDNHSDYSDHSDSDNDYNNSNNRNSKQTNTKSSLQSNNKANNFNFF